MSIGSEEDVFIYLDDLDSKGAIDMGRIRNDVMFFFNLPPARSVEIINKWARTFTKRRRIFIRELRIERSKK